MAGYSARQSTFTTGDTITAAHSNNEFNAILAAFHVSTGHKHDGSTAGDGGPISTLFSNAISMGTGADTDIALTFNANTNDGVLTWMEDEDYFQFSDDILISTTEKIQFRDTAIYINSSADGQLDLVADTEIQIAATTIDMNGNVDVSGTLVFGSLGDGTVTITDIADEDNMSSNSATKLATQQSIKAYVDATVTAEDLDVTSDSGTIAIDLDSETLTIAGGTGLASSATSNTVTLAIDSTVTTLTGSQTLTNKTLTSPVLNTGVSGTAILDEDNLASDSATKLATQQSIKAYVDGQVGGVSTTWTLEDDDGTEVGVASGKEVKFIGSGITTNWTDTDNGTDADPYDMTFTVDAAQTGITSILATDLKIGEDNETKIDFEEANEIHFYAANAEQIYVADGIFGPQTDSDVDLGATGVRWKDAFVDSLTITDNITVGGDLTVNGTTTTVNSTTVTIDDPIFTLGGDSAPGSDDNKDRGIEFRWHNGTAAKVGFFGYDDSASVFTFIPDASNSSEVFSGTVGNVVFGNIAGTLTTAAQTNITSVGALDGGSITSNFGAINTGSSNITTTGAISGGTLAGTLNANQLSGTVANARLDAELQALAGLTSAADKGIQFTGDGTAGVYDLTAAGKALLDDANASAQRTTLGLGTAATQAVGTSASNVVQLDGSAKLPAVDGSALTNVVAGGIINKVADGAIAIRKPVVLTAAGKAKEVAETTTTDTTSVTLSNGSAGAQERGTNNVNRHSTTYDTNSDRFVTAYADDGNSGYGTAVVHTLSNASTGAMTYGTPVVFESADIDMGSDGTKYIVFDSSANRVVIAYRDRGDSDKGKAVVGSVNSGTNAISFGTPVEFESGTTNFISTVYHPNVDRTVIFYTDNDDSVYGKGIVGTVTAGTNAIAFGTASNFHEGTTYNKAAAYEPDTHKILIAYDDRTGGDTGEGLVATVTGGTDNSIAYGSATQFNDNVPASLSMDYDTTANKFVMSFKDEGTSNASTAIVGTISGTSVSFGSKVVIESTNSADRVVLFDPDLERTMLVYLDTTNDKIKLHYIAISGTTPSSLGSLEVATTDDAGGGVSAAYDPDNNKFVVMFQDSDDDLNAMMINSAFASSTTTNLDNGNYLGISAEAISDTATGKINVIGGTSTGHSSLTIGNHYFTNAAGTIGLVGNTLGEQYLGKAISATEIQLLENEGYLYGTAEGAVTAGKPVQVASDGDFEMISSSTTNFTYAVGSEVEYLSDSIASHDVAYDTYRNKVILATHGTSAGTLRVYVGTVTGGSTNSISWGAAQDIYTKNGDFVKVAYDPVSYQTMIAWVNTSNGRIDAVVITEDGDGTITAGSVTTGLEGSSAADRRHDLINVGERKWVLVYKDISTTYMNSRVLTTTGTDITAQTETVIKSENTDRMAVAVNTEAMGAYAANTRLVYFRANGASSDMKILGATLDGNSITGVGTEHNMLDAFQPNAGSAVYDPESNRFCCAARKADVDGRFVSLVLDASDNSIGSVTESAFESGNTMAGLQVLAELGKVHICYGDRGDSTKGKIVDVTINSGTGAATYGTQNVFFTGVLNFTNSPIASGSDLGFVFDSDTNRFVAVYVDDATVDGQSVVGSLVGSKTISNIATDGESYIGIATKTVADDAQVEVATFGQIDAQQSGLTAGQKYFVQSDGSLGTSADSKVTTVAGKALSATKLLISE